MSHVQEFTKGLLRENPVFKLVLGMCPTLAVTTSAENGIGMGLASTFVLVCSNVLVSLLRNVIPAKVRIPAFIVIIASFVTVVDLTMNAYFHQLHKALGLFIPLIVVNCIILGRAEAFASKNKVTPAIADGLGMGIGFTLALFVLGSTRELLGSGSVLGVPILSSLIGAIGWDFKQVIVMILPPGAFIALGVILSIINAVSKRMTKAPASG
ncbi:MAG: electron transport complex subunit E [Candidatus Lernaella stagnicola]|nr:electron transport complex subunit E [Candidatus Lernaella stagnicola]